MSKTIGMVLDGFYPSDIRVQKEANALIKAGFKVALLCKRRKNEEAFTEYDGIQLMRINAGISHTEKGLMDIVLALNFVHPIFKRSLPMFIKKFSIGILHIHDLPLVKTGIIAAKKHDLNVVVDFHENYPEALNVWFEWKKNPVIRLKNKVFFGYKRWDAYEKWAIENTDYIIAVVDEMKERILFENNIDENKICIVSNTEEKRFVNNNLDESIYGQDKNKFIIAYTGGVGPHRGVDTAIKAMVFLRNKPDIVFYIVGTISKAAKKELALLIDTFNLEDTVKILGYRPFSEFYSYMKMASLNLIPHHSNGHTDNTIPHKLFQCMMVGKPVIVSSSAPLKRVIDETQAGLVFTAGDANDLANKILELYEDDKRCQKLGISGQKATLEGQYNWEQTSEVLIEFYRGVLKKML